MDLKPLDLASLIPAIAWPAVAIGALVVFRKPLAELIAVLGQRVDKISIAGISLQLAKASEMKPQSLDTQLRALDAGKLPQSGPLDLLVQFREAGIHDYVVIELGSAAAPRWLTSRLYLFALLLTRVGRLKCFVFVETVGEFRHRFIGTAAPEAVRRALAVRYPWLEQAYAQAYAQLGLLNFDTATGSLVEWQASALLQQFLAIIRRQAPIPLQFPDPDKPPDVVDLGDGIFEYAKWIDGGRLERILGAELAVASVTIPPEKTLDDVTGAVLGQNGPFVAVTEADRTFRSLIDRSTVLESLAHSYARKMT